jgi:hypothetical protein
VPIYQCGECRLISVASESVQQRGIGVWIGLRLANEAADVL